MRGSGKTRFARRLVTELARLYPAANVYVLDSKGADDFWDWPGQTFGPDAPEPLDGEGLIQVWRPGAKVPDEFEAWLDGILHAGTPAVLLIDELVALQVGRGGRDYVPSLGAVMKQGRGLGLCPIILDQQGTYILSEVKEQATHFTFFHLGLSAEAGLRHACAMLDLPAPRRGEPRLRPRGRWGFFHRMLEPPGPVHEYRDLADFFGDAD